MPRLPVDEVIEHRFSLGQYERDQLDTLVTGQTISNVATPTVNLLSDVSALVALTTLLEALGVIDLTGWAWEGAQRWYDKLMQGLFDSLPAAIGGALGDIADEYGIDYPQVAGVTLTPAVILNSLSELEAGKRAQAERAIAQVTSLPTRLYIWSTLQVRNLGGLVLG